MSESNGQISVQKLNMSRNDADFQVANKALDAQRIRVDEVTRTYLQGEQEKKGKQIFHSAKTRETLTKILSADYTNEKWILQKKGKRDSKKNINAAYKKITGKGGFFGGLSRSDKATRQSEFEDRRMRSLEASKAVAAVAAEADLGEDMEPLEMVKAISAVDISKFNIEDDYEFVKDFAANMKDLQRAEMLLDYFRSEEGRELMGQNEEVSEKLLWMKSIKEAYLDRITLISSPYYVSMRDEDFTGRTQNRMREKLKDSKVSDLDKAYFKAYLRSYERKTSLREDVFRFDKEQAFPKRRMKAMFYEEARKNKGMQKGMNLVTDRDDSGKYVENFLNGHEFATFREHDFITGNGTPRWMRDYENPTVSEFIDGVRKMKDKINELLKAEKEYEEKTRNAHWDPKLSDLYREQLEREAYGERPEHLSSADRRQMDDTLKILDNIIDRVEKGEISMDVARAWLDRTTGQIRQAGYLAEGSRLHQQDNEEYRKSRKKLSDEEKETEISKNISELGSIVYKHSGNLGALGYVTIRGAEDKEVAGKRYMHRDNLEKNRNFAISQHFYSEDLTGNLDEICEKSGKKVGSHIHIYGGRFHGERADSSYKVTISTNPKWKNVSVDELLSYANEKHLLNYMFINIRTGVDGPCDDDITLLFSKDLSRENIKEFLDGYSQRCEKIDKDILVHEESMMPTTSVKYKDGISMAPRIPVDMLQWIKEETKELGKYSSDSRLNSDQGEVVRERKKNKMRPEHLSFERFIYEQMILSYQIAYRRLADLPNVLGSGTTLEKIDVDNGLYRAEIKKVFRELMILNGIDPETMTSLKVRDEVEEEKKKGKKISLSEVLDRLEKEHNKA